MTQFFNKFPAVYYANSIAKNLLSRVNMSKLAFTDKQAFYAYVTKDGQRPDHISYDYYDDPDYVWLLALANQVIDPYYEFSVKDDDIDSLIIKKYGSLSIAQNTLLFFENNYVNDDSNITVSNYNSLSTSLQKYWAPQLGYNNQIIGYVRKQENWAVSTNQSNQLILASVTGTFLPEERIIQNGEVIGTCDSFYGTSMTIKHVTNALVASLIMLTEDGLILTSEDNLSLIEESEVVIGELSGAKGYIIGNAVATTNIPLNELGYWYAVSAYEYEHRINHDKRHVNMLDNRYSASAAKQLKNLLSQ